MNRLIALNCHLSCYMLFMFFTATFFWGEGVSKQCWGPPVPRWQCSAAVWCMLGTKRGGCLRAKHTPERSALSPWFLPLHKINNCHTGQLGEKPTTSNLLKKLGSEYHSLFYIFLQALLYPYKGHDK